MDRVIILEGGPATGKTVLANLITLRGSKGSIVEHDQINSRTFSSLDIAQICYPQPFTHSALVVFCTQNAGALKRTKVFQEVIRRFSHKTPCEPHHIKLVRP